MNEPTWHLSWLRRDGRVLAALSAALFVLGGHLWMIARASSPVPVHDQWLAEGEMLYVPLVEDRLTLTPIIHPHAEHRIVPTRALAVGLFALNDRVWDVRLQMTVNALLAAALTSLFVLIASRVLGPRALVLFALVFGVGFASPLFYGNALWGFQSQFYFLLLFSVAHLDLVLRHQAFSGRWWIGVICSLLACVSMGSGFFSAAVVAVITVGQFAVSRERPSKRSALLNLSVHLALCAIAVSWSSGLTPTTIHWSSVIHTFVHCLSWPHRYYNPVGIWVWLPFMIFVGTLARPSQRTPATYVVLALGLWVLAQIVAISIVRSTPAIVITPRYYEILGLGVVANALALYSVWQRANSIARSVLVKSALFVPVLAWTLAVGFQAWHFAAGHARDDLRVLAGYASIQTERVRTFLSTDDVAVLKTVPYPQVPHPDAEYLARLLRTPSLRNALPVELRNSSPPSLSRATAAVRRSYPVIVVLAFLVWTLSAVLALRWSVSIPTPAA
jgi:hypothetical protein